METLHQPHCTRHTSKGVTESETIESGIEVKMKTYLDRKLMDEAQMKREPKRNNKCFHV